MKNGQIPRKRLVDVGHGWLLNPAAAADFEAWAQAMKDNHGFDLVAAVACAYRPLGKPSDPANTSADTQWTAWNYYQAHGRPLAAHPGTSNHGLGRALDLHGGIEVAGSSAHLLAVKIGKKYGWTWGEVPSEPWHFTHYRGTPLMRSIRMLIGTVRRSLINPQLKAKKAKKAKKPVKGGKK